MKPTIPEMAHTRPLGGLMLILPIDNIEGTGNEAQSAITLFMMGKISGL